ncbi:hypothetical protein PAPYR_536 [Paratrimastix pyriformis]|uniref:Uncharacterized protein n=1 Tax=Paratrimastix pyriformis TaxID=342808 RepID=A0ABQ8UVH5_9EUKA|nr:hypothetical protein PAPYR_536 [Paratrimastix pyriformis]
MFAQMGGDACHVCFVDVYIPEYGCATKYLLPLAAQLEAAHQEQHPGRWDDDACTAACPALHQLGIGGHFCGAAGCRTLDAAFRRAQCDLRGWQCANNCVGTPGERYSQAFE